MYSWTVRLLALTSESGAQAVLFPSDRPMVETLLEGGDHRANRRSVLLGLRDGRQYYKSLSGVAVHGAIWPPPPARIIENAPSHGEVLDEHLRHEPVPGAVGYGARVQRGTQVRLQRRGAG